MNDYIKSDLMRYYGKYNFITMLKALIINRTFRFQYIFRLCNEKGVKRIIGNIF